MRTPRALVAASLVTLTSLASAEGASAVGNGPGTLIAGTAAAGYIKDSANGEQKNIVCIVGLYAGQPNGTDDTRNISFAAAPGCRGAEGRVTFTVDAQLRGGSTDIIKAVAPRYGPATHFANNPVARGQYARLTPDEQSRVSGRVEMTLPATYAHDWSTAAPGCSKISARTVVCSLTSAPFDFVPDESNGTGVPPVPHLVCWDYEHNCLEGLPDVAATLADLEYFATSQSLDTLVDVDDPAGDMSDEPDPPSTGVFAITPEFVAEEDASEPSTQAAGIPYFPADCLGYAAAAKYSYEDRLIYGYGAVQCAKSANLSIKTCLARKKFGVSFFSIYEDQICSAWAGGYMTRAWADRSLYCTPGTTHKYRTHVHVQISRGSRKGRGHGYQLGRRKVKCY